jgi:hypothetical protein
VLELCALQPAPRALVLDAHPALRLHSAAFRRAPAAETPCAFAFPAPGSGPPPPPLPAFAETPASEPACCPLAFRLDPFTDYGSSLTVTLPPELQAHQPFQVILRYTSTDAPAVSLARVGTGAAGLSRRPLAAWTGQGIFICTLLLGHLQRERGQPVLPGALADYQLLPASS